MNTNSNFKGGTNNGGRSILTPYTSKCVKEFLYLSDFKLLLFLLIGVYLLISTKENNYIWLYLI